MKIYISLSVATRKLPFYKNCTQFSRRDTDKEGGLSDCVNNAREITYKTFVGKVDSEDLKMLSEHMGYGKYLKLQDDYAVSFHKSKLFGKVVYYVTLSAIEYIFGDF